MNIIFFTHPDFAGHQSMPRFAKMLAEGMQKRGHETEIWSPKPVFFNLSGKAGLRKWLGYIDQFVIFPAHVRNRVKKQKHDTLYVFTDHALGPWVPLVKDKAHVIHCHDFLAQRSALGEIKENPTGYSGKQYQNFIRRGYLKGKNFISVSKKTQEDLHRFLQVSPGISEVVYNGLNQQFNPVEPATARVQLSKETGIKLNEGYLLHVGGNQWYKNRIGVIEIYNAWRKTSDQTLPLLLIGEEPSIELKKKKSESEYNTDIYFLRGLKDGMVRLAYSGATVFLFPSIAEGFGWPIAEAMASGCPVITTNEAPMTEVAGDAAFLIDNMPENAQAISLWAGRAGQLVNTIVELPPASLSEVVEKGILNSKRFEVEQALNKMEQIYYQILKL